MDNRTYIGIAIYNQHNSKSRRTRLEEKWIPIPLPPIVDKQPLFAAEPPATLKMSESAEKPTTELFSKIARCVCGNDSCGGGVAVTTGEGG
jgi:hypothetical protein